MNRGSLQGLLVAASLMAGLPACAQDTTAALAQKYYTPDPIQGDWASADGKSSGPVAQVIAEGGGKYRIQVLNEFDKREQPIAVLQGQEDTGVITAQGDTAKAVISNETLDGSVGEKSFSLKRVERKSPTLGQKPPEGAVVMFDGKSLDKWKKKDGQPLGWKLTEDGAMRVWPRTGDAVSVDKLGDSKIHVEFRSPLMPEARGQKRGNSGVYLAGVYEIQVLDSYGLEGAENECGGMYKAARPNVNMCAPPLQWQTYDIDYVAPKFAASGEKTSPAKVTVRHNGVLIHENLELPGHTPGGLANEEPRGPAPILLQDHGDLVEYRNIWAVPAR